MGGVYFGLVRAGVNEVERLKVRVLTRVLVAVFQGFSLAVGHATVVDIVQSYCATFDAVTLAQSVRALGFVAGSLLGAPLIDRIKSYSDVTLAICNLLFGVAASAIPWSPNLIVMGVFFFLLGWCQSVVDISKKRPLIRLYKNNDVTCLCVNSLFDDVSTTVAHSRSDGRARTVRLHVDW